MVNRTARLAMLLAGACALSACNHAKSPAEVAKDTQAAEHKAIDEIAKAEQTAADKEASARKDVRGEQRDYAHVAAVQDQNVADTAADGARKVELARCEALNGAAQKACRDQADAEYDEAKARAKQERIESDPKQH